MAGVAGETPFEANDVTHDNKGEPNRALPDDVKRYRKKLIKS
jgi:hypothetical protein